MERINLLKQFLEKNPGDSFLQHALGLELKKMGNKEQALKVWIDLLSKDPSYVGTYYQVTQLLNETGRTEEAVAYCEKGMQVAKQAGDQHTYNELRAVYDDLTF